MILQSLCEYYERKPDLPRAGFETKGIPFVIAINTAGEFVQFEDTRYPPCQTSCRLDWV